MTFHIITLFPQVIEAYVGESIIGRAIKNKLLKINVVDLRKFGEGKRRTVDERAYGGGPGMVLKIGPLLRALQSLKLKVHPPKFSKGKLRRVKSSKLKVIITSAGGKTFTNQLASQYSKKYNDIVVVCGHYEGIDERLKKALKDQGYAVAEVSIGDYVLTGGELPALVMIDSIARKIPGVLGKYESLEENRSGVGVPSYTRPETFIYKTKKYSVPKVLLSGHHANIEKWRLAKRKS